MRVSEHAEAAARDEALLDAEERRRVAAFIREADRDRYRVAHLALRRELGARLDLDPARITFVREPCPCCGKPHGRPAVPGAGVHFSLSHAHDLVLLAFSGRPVGADVERRPSLETAEQTAVVLHSDERAELAALPSGERAAAFARCWTRKEAYLKGTGSGLGEDPGLTYVGAGPRPGTVPGWILEDIPVPDDVPEDYAAAAAVRTDGGPGVPGTEALPTGRAGRNSHG